MRTQSPKQQQKNHNNDKNVEQQNMFVIKQQFYLNFNHLFKKVSTILINSHTQVKYLLLIISD